MNGKTMLSRGLRVAMVAAFFVPMVANAETCAYENADGKKMYSDKPPGYGWKRRQCFHLGVPSGGPKSTISKPVAIGSSGGSSSSSSSGTLPRVSKQQQSGRDIQRRQLLQEELATETRLLENAVKSQVLGLAPVSTEEMASAQIYTKRIASLNEEVTLHERNIEALKKELSR